MGHPDKISPDVVEWLVSDEAVISRWKPIARRLNLESYIGGIDRNYSYKNKKLDRAKMKELMEVWQKASPITYTKSRLMEVLSREGLNDMFMWLQLMGTEKSRRKEEVDYLLHSPRSAISLSPQPPLSLASSSSSRQGCASVPASYHSLPASPYSWYFDANGQQQQNHHGILKKKNGRLLSNGGGTASNSSQADSADYTYLRNSTDSNASRESTPEDSLSRPLSRISLCESSAPTTPAPNMIVPPRQKCIRFADEPPIRNGSSEPPEPPKRSHTMTDSEYLVRSPRKGTDNSVERYFDNLITMIEDAAEGL